METNNPNSKPREREEEAHMHVLTPDRSLKNIQR